MFLYDHNDMQWRSIYRRHGRENGAATYSREICQFQIPVWQEAFPYLTVSTCASLSGRFLPGGDLAVQYLHSWPYEDPLGFPQRLVAELGPLYRQVAFVVAYRPFQALLRASGLTALYVPMSIDLPGVQRYRLPASGRLREIAYYGNVRPPKRVEFRRLQEAGTFHHVQLRQPVSWEKLAQFNYGIGVGRCAMEMAALGLRVLVSGSNYGGLVMTPADEAAQREVNFNGRIVTGAPTLREGLDLLPRSLLWTPMDSREGAQHLRAEIQEHLDGHSLHL